MSYTVTEDTVKWARKRVEQVNAAEIDIGAALEKMDGVVEEIRTGCDKMDDQWDSDMFRAYANDLEKLLKDMNERFEEMRKDRNAVRRAIRKYEGSKGNDNNT